MATPAYGSATGPVFQELSVSTNLVINKPTSTAEGDLLLAQIAYMGGSAPTSVPSGWTYLRGGSKFDGGIEVEHRIYWKTASASEPSSYTWGISDSVSTWGVGGIVRVTGVGQAIGTNHAGRDGTTSPAICPSVSGSFVDYRTFRFFVAGDWESSAFSFNGIWTGDHPDNENIYISAGYNNDSDGTIQTQNVSLVGDMPWHAITVVTLGESGLNGLEIMLGAVF